MLITGSQTESRMAKPTIPPDPAEPDLYWAGHSGWAMIPGLVIGAVVSVIVLFGLPPIGDWIGLPYDWTAFLLFWITFFCWVAAGIVWAYRGSSFVYRLTPRRLYVDFGALYPPVTPIDLSGVTGVECRAWALRRLFGVGAIIVRAEDRPPVRLRGIFRPERFAEAIGEAVQKANRG
jgi:hypothetical protein